MNLQPNAYMMLPGISPEEITLIQQATTGLTEEQQRYFYNMYASKRKNPQDILLFTLLGFTMIGGGIQRFVLGQIGMGILYWFTGGLCLIGTIVDLVNYKQLTLEYNTKMAYESHQMVSMSGGQFYKQ